MAMIAYFTFTTVVFRSELIILFAPMILDVMIRKQLSIPKIIMGGLGFGLLSLGTPRQLKNSQVCPLTFSFFIP